MIDQALSCKLHIHSLVLKIHKIGGIFRKVSELTTFQSKYLLYYSMLYPYLLYGIEIYGGAGSSINNDLQIAQNKAIKALFKLPKHTSSSTLYTNLGLAKLDEIYNNRSITLIRKILTEEKFLNIHSTFLEHNPMLCHKYETRSNNNSINLLFNRPSYTRGITFSLFLIWNNNIHIC